MLTECFIGNDEGNVRSLRLHEVAMVGGKFEKVVGTETDVAADLVFLAMGFTGAERGPLIDGLGVEIDGRGNVARGKTWATNVDGVFVAGDMAAGSRSSSGPSPRGAPAPPRWTRS